MIIQKEDKLTQKKSDQHIISIIIVTYNAAKTLQQCLNSIYIQKYPTIEIIVIDGNSSDNTKTILQNNSNQITYWKSEPDNGIYDAMNKAIKHVQSDRLYFLGADDELLPEFSDMANELTDPSTIYYGNVFVEGEKKLGKLIRYQFAKFGPYHQAMIYPKAVFNKYKFDLKYNISADFALTLTLCGDKDFRFAYKDFTIANFNHSGISGSQIDTHFQKDKPALILKNFGLKTWFRYMIHQLKNKKNPRA